MSLKIMARKRAVGAPAAALTDAGIVTEADVTHKVEREAAMRAVLADPVPSVDPSPDRFERACTLALAALDRGRSTSDIEEAIRVLRAAQ